MEIGVPREIKPDEGRVALLPAQVAALHAAGQRVHVERGAGRSSGAEDAAYQDAGAILHDAPEPLFEAAGLIAKVKEILPAEYPLLRRDHVLLTCLHTAANRPLTDVLLEVGLTAFSTEEMHADGSPNCPLAGEIGALEGLRLCFAPMGGSGRHFLPHFGAPALHALVLGLGGVGGGALRTLVRLGCRVDGFDIDPGARSRAELTWNGHDFRAHPIAALADLLPQADLVVNCVLWPKHRPDHLIAQADLARMKRGAVIADVSCDESGAVETSRPTSWESPTYAVDGITHFCVDNLPAAVPVSASAGYARAMLGLIQAIAAWGPVEACRRDPWIARGLTCIDGRLILTETGHVQDRPVTTLEAVLEAA